MLYSSSASQYRIWQAFQRRLYVFLGLVLGVALLFAIQLVNFQIINGSQLEKQATLFGTRTVNLKAPRGNMFDRNYISLDRGKKLVSSYPSLDVMLKPILFRKDKAQIRAFVSRFAELLGLPRDYYSSTMADGTLDRILLRNEDIMLLKDISQGVMERISGFNEINSKVEIVSSSRRVYHYRTALAHVTGYIGPPTPEILAKNKGVKSDDLVGIAGLEKQYNEYLMGEDGIKVLRHSGFAGSGEEFVKKHPIPGKNLVLTIDAEIQKTIYLNMQEKVGAVVVMRPGTGEVLGLFSNPSYDPQILSWSQDKAAYQAHLEVVRRFKGFQNRAIQNTQPPASTFKPLVALAALTEMSGEVDEDFSYTCTKKYIVKSQYAGSEDHTFNCYERHNEVNMTGAIAQSCSAYFYNLGRKLGSQKILEYALLFGLNKKTGIDLPHEKAGFLPSKAWKQASLGENWYVGDTILLAIGQGFTQVTPLGMALVFAGFANGGTIYQPYLLREVRDPVTDEVLFTQPSRRVLRDIPLSASALAIVRKGLQQVTTQGTAKYVIGNANLPPIAGKTGTAQTRSGGEDMTQHGWFIGWGPVEAPVEEQVLTAVFIEYGGTGAGGAGPVAREVFKTAFRGKKWDPESKTLVQLDKR